MADSIPDSEGIDPEIADLLGDDLSSDSAPNFSDLFNDAEKDGSDASAAPEEDFSRQTFVSIDRWEQDSNPLFFDKDFYTKVLTGEGEASQRVHRLLQKFLKAEDPQERGVFRQQLIPAWWDLVKDLSVHYRNNAPEKRWAVRYGYILPTLVSQEQRRMLSKIVGEKAYNEPVYYVDEWYDLILTGSVNPLASDDFKLSKTNKQTKSKIQLEKMKGSKEANYTLLRNMVVQREGNEADLLKLVQSLMQHPPHPSIPGVTEAYNRDQKQAFGRINSALHKLNLLNRDIAANIVKHLDAEKELGKIGDEIKEMGELNKVDTGLVENETESIRQMAKMCVGRQGNHIPFLMKNFFVANMQLIGTRENIIRYMDEVEQVDAGVFLRTFRQKTNRIVPHTILIPCYGDRGICWEPFERYNRSTSRGRIAIPMFPRNLKLAVIYALGDLRWSVAKEKSAHYWMEEGLTGNYYQWFSSKKMRGDVRLHFLEDYVLWITKEVDGMQKLDKDVRSIFWRHLPFSQPVKDVLRNRGFVYNELYKKDINRAVSDGY